MSGSRSATARPLSWAGIDGKPCSFLGDGGEYVSRIADDIERLQLGMAYELLAHVTYRLDGYKATSRELLVLARGLAIALRTCGVLRRAGCAVVGNGMQPWRGPS